MLISLIMVMSSGMGILRLSDMEGQYNQRRVQLVNGYAKSATLGYDG